MMYTNLRSRHLCVCAVLSFVPNLALADLIVAGSATSSVSSSGLSSQELEVLEYYSDSDINHYYERSDNGGFSGNLQDNSDEGGKVKTQEFYVTTVTGPGEELPPIPPPDPVFDYDLNSPREHFYLTEVPDLYIAHEGYATSSVELLDGGGGKLRTSAIVDVNQPRTITPNFGINASSRAALYDTIFVEPQDFSFIVQVFLDVDGILRSDGFGATLLDARLSAGNSESTFSTSTPYGGALNIINERLMVEFDVFAGMDSFDISASLSTQALTFGGDRAWASADFTNTASLMVSLPEGIDWYSGSSVFLGEITVPNNTVPLPQTIALFSLGLCILGWSRRKKESNIVLA